MTNIISLILICKCVLNFVIKCLNWILDIEYMDIETGSRIPKYKMFFPADYKGKNWPISEDYISNQNWWQKFHCFNIHVVYIHYLKYEDEYTYCANLPRNLMQISISAATLYGGTTISTSGKIHWMYFFYLFMTCCCLKLASRCTSKETGNLNLNP